jgi:BirA family biotin operon repressor/biotin-[acetyl-CoA-carboxylase] ligase
MVKHKKISSCFCEILPSPKEEFCYLLIGVNLNINMTPEQTALVPSSTSMLVEAGKEFDKELVLKTVSCCLKNSINDFLEKGVRPKFFNDVDRYLAFKGQRIEVELGPNSVVEGKLIGLDKDGSFLLEMCRGEIWKINGGRILRVLTDESEAYSR